MKEAPTPLADGERTALYRTGGPIRHPKRSSWKLCNEYGTSCSMQHSYGFDNSLQHVFVECQPSSCFPPPSIGDCILTGGDPIPEKRGHPPWPVWENDIDAHKHPIFYNNAREGSRPRENTAEGLTSKTGSGSVDCGSPSRGRTSTARFGGVTVVKSEAMPSRYSTTRFGGVTVVLAGAKKSNTSDIEQFWRPKIRRWIRSTTWCSTCCRVTLKLSSESQHRRDGVAPHSTRVLTTV
ncbi:BZ3500_MvSof-1268-A1-R1_Chr7-1g09394 [Microbotryum saponariae]|uniref:BZ3500_MvSof-1268-A1-R1_Chr7-1g09394 protein n=1 Tax=Microbotryum saponariae TaxID=289078 RepID=A0A2X0LS62_9BASI|nr:BZ3501_MvSof-1269-A2-R1_Chr7-1g09099 [Microbotryum saponariae]SDA03355.1 BZ3500_MvSof-1268-A1-R1_Chr7-1g09394 [Microbotryum saponariae]